MLITSISRFAPSQKPWRKAASHIVIDDCPTGIYDLHNIPMTVIKIVIIFGGGLILLYQQPVTAYVV